MTRREKGDTHKRRALAVLDEIAVGHGPDVAVVTHGGFIMVLICAAWGWRCTGGSTFLLRPIAVSAPLFTIPRIACGG
jgi:broad specificity phosphatase PhoE